MKAKNPVASSGNGSNALGTWLKERCNTDHLSLRQAAVKAGLSHATISDIINGGRPSAATIVKLAEAFGKDGNQQEKLKDLLLSLSGYRGENNNEGDREARGRLLDKLSHLNPEQLELVDQLTSFITSTAQPGMRSLRSSTGVLVLPKLRLNFYLSFDSEEPDLVLAKLPPDMQQTIIDLAERYKKESGQSPE